MKFLATVLLVAVGATTILGLPVSQSHSRAWESSGHYQGDILLTEDQKNGIVDRNGYWTNRQLFYTISPTFTAADRGVIVDVINWYNANTCINMIERTNQANFVEIGNGNEGCYSYVGMIGNAQELNLGNGCVWHDTVAHELLHALGFYHMQSATDRDDYVIIQWQNIQDGYAYAFDKYEANFITDFGVTYDYGSVMHYGPYAFSFNGERTILTVDPDAEIGEAPTLSPKDIQKLHLMYQC